MRSAPGSATVLLAALGLGAALLWVSGRGEPSPDPLRPAAPAAPDEAPAAPVRTAEGAVQLVVDVELRAVLVPPRGPAFAPCRLVAAGVEVPARVRLLAGARAAVPDAAVGGLHLAAFELGGETFCRVVQLDAAATVDVGLGPPAPLRGRVEDEAGRPIPGARVWAGDLDPVGAPRTVTTGADGAFEFAAVRGGRGVPLAVAAEGHASRCEVADLPDRGAEPRLVQLGRASRVEVVFHAPVADRSLGELRIAPRAADLDLLHYPFFAAALCGAPRLAADGTAAIDDLPDRAVVEVWVDHPELCATAPREVRTRSRLPARVQLGGLVGIPLAGTVRGLDGAPIAGATVALRTSRSAVEVLRAGELLPPAAHRPPGGHATTAADGTFRLPRPRDGEAVLLVDAPGHCGAEVRLGAAPAAAALEVALPEAASFAGPPLLRVHLRPEGRTVLARRVGTASVRAVDGAPFEVRLDAPALVDATVRVVDAGGLLYERRFTDLAVTGPVDLRIDA